MNANPLNPGRKTWQALFSGLLIICFLAVPMLVVLDAYYQWHTPTMDFYLDAPGSATVRSVIAGGQAEKAGLEAGDVILTADDTDFKLWSAPRIGATHLLKILRRGDILTLAVPAIRLIGLNLIPLIVTAATALIFWGIGSLLLVRRFGNPEFRLFFLTSTAMAAAVLFPLSFGDPWNPPDQLLSISFAAFCLLAPLFLHYAISFPVKLGDFRKRLWSLIAAYTLSLFPVVGWVIKNRILVQVGLVFSCLALSAAVAFAVYSYQYRAGAQERRRTRIIYAGATLAGVLFLAVVLLPDALHTIVRLPHWTAGPILLLAPSVYLYATLHFNLFGIDRLINRTLVYSILSLGIFTAYIVPYLILYRFIPDDLFAHIVMVFILTLWVGWTFDWMRFRAQRLADRFFYGGWYDFAAVVERISDDLAHSFTRAQINHVLTEQVPQLMHFRRSSLWIERADSPTTPLEQARFQNKFATQVPAVWTVDAHQDGDDLSAEDLRILNTLAHQAEIALNNAFAIEKLEAQLEEIRGKREELSRAQRQLLRSREDERLRLARDLHDNPIQSLVGLNIQLGLLLHETDPIEPGKQALTDMQVEVRRLISELRQVCAELRPPMLDALGLSSALRALVSDWNETNPTEVRLDLCPDSSLRTLPSEAAVNLYRVAQEALVNIGKHAGAVRVRFSLTWENEHLSMIISDDGKGFDPSGKYSDLTADGHYGLVGMQERINLIGGDWRLDSTPGKGTLLQVVWPGKGDLK